jgi:ADP-heptose:LPS heptosyltransferase
MKLSSKQIIDKYIGRSIVFFLVVIVRLLGIIIRRNHTIEKPPKTIMVIKMMGIGSLFMASDSIYSLKQKYLNTRLVLLCGKPVSLGIGPLKLFDEIIEIDDSTFYKLIKSSTSALLRSWKYKKLWILDLEVYSVLTTIFSVFTFGVNRFGFQLSKVHFRYYLNTHNTYFNQFISAYKNYENIVYTMGVDYISEFVPNIQNKALDYSLNYIAINNTCSELGGHLRKIPDNKLLKIVNFILENSQLKLAFTGTNSDYFELDSLLKEHYSSYQDRVLVIAGKFTFSEYYSFLKFHCIGMITIDSAPFHFAVKFKIPSVSLWGPINPYHRFNFTDQSLHHFYYLNSDCSPCIHQTEIVPCKGNNICMKNMEEDHIYLLINNLISNEAKQ